MIEINLLPGSGKKSRGRSTGPGLGATLSGVAARIKDPFLLGAVGAVAASLLVVGGLFARQASLEASLDEQLQAAVQDSTRYAAVLGERRAAESRRDSVLRQLAIIKSIDNNRFVWPHLMDEISRVMPPYTWLTQVIQTSGLPQPAPDAPAPGEKKKGAADSVQVVEAMRFKMVGNTVDIQALTRFMKDLEASPFIQNVALDKSTMVVADGKEVTEFQLNAEYQQPDSSAIRLQPLALSVR